MPLFVAYHGLDAASHQSRVNELAPQGYRPISLSVSGGLVSTAPTIARFISRYAVWGLGARSVATRHGTFDGTTSGARSRPDGVDFAYVFNRRVTEDEHNGITKAIDAYLDAHPV